MHIYAATEIMQRVEIEDHLRIKLQFDFSLRLNLDWKILINK